MAYMLGLFCQSVASALLSVAWVYVWSCGNWAFVKSLDPAFCWSAILAGDYDGPLTVAKLAYSIGSSGDGGFAYVRDESS